MKTINSISGGKTSSYMAYNHPADYNLFSLVCLKDIKTKIADNNLIKIVNDKFEKSGFIKYGEFIGTAEDLKTIKIILDLEQLLGKEIIWVRGEYFDDIIKKKNFLPNLTARWCTPNLKITPIVEWCYANSKKSECGDIQPFFMNVGIRYDEYERAKIGKEREVKHKIIIGKKNGRNKWKEIFYAVHNYPLINDKIFRSDIIKFWNKFNLDFPDDSNCIGCFWKDVQQLRKNWDDNPEIMEWFSNQEKLTGHWFKSHIQYEQIKNIGIQQDFFFGTGSGCQAGFCTD